MKLIEDLKTAIAASAREDDENDEAMSDADDEKTSVQMGQQERKQKWLIFSLRLIVVSFSQGSSKRLLKS